MRLFSLFVAATASVASASASVASVGVLNSPPLDQLTLKNHFGAPIPPWEPECRPGWYYGNAQQLADPSIICLNCLNGLVCSLLDLLATLIGTPCLRCPASSFSNPTQTSTAIATGTATTNGTVTSTSTSTTPTATPSFAGYDTVFYEGNAAIIDDSYITFGLTDSNQDCVAMCGAMSECKCANAYNDVYGKDNKPQKTCSLFGRSVNATEATNFGNQSQIEGEPNNYIQHSCLFCKS